MAGKGKPPKEFRQKTELEKLTSYGFHKEVAEKIDSFSQSGILMSGALDKGARRALKALPLGTALAALEKFEHTVGEVPNKSRHLCFIISKFRAAILKREKRRMCHLEREKSY